MPIIYKEISDWVSVNTESGIGVGTLMNIQNQGSKFVICKDSVSKPDVTDFSGEKLSTQFYNEASKIVTEGSDEVWVRRIGEGSGFIKLYVQTWVA